MSFLDLFFFHFLFLVFHDLLFFNCFKEFMTINFINDLTWLAGFSCFVLVFGGWSIFSVGFLLLYILDLFFDRCYSLRLFFDFYNLLFRGIVRLFRLIRTCCFFL